MPDVSQAFDRYWNSERAYPVATLMPAAQAGAMDKLRNDLAVFYQEKQTSVYVDALKNSALAETLRRRRPTSALRQAKIIYDSPDKQAKGDDWKEELLISQLAPYIQQATREFILVSPYFVPGQRAADALCALSQKGVRVRILTNSLVSNDVAAVHAGYMRHREQLVRCGVELYELNEQIKKQQGEAVYLASRPEQIEPARQDDGDRWRNHVRRLAQLRSAISEHQQRDRDSFP